MFKKKPLYRQKSAIDCGITCLRMVCKYYGKQISTKRLRSMTEIESVGVSLAAIKKTAEELGFRAHGKRLQNVGQLRLLQTKLPVIVHWNSNHFVVVYAIGKNKVTIADPSRGMVKVDYDEFYRRAFRKSLIDEAEKECYVLVLTATEDFKALEEDRSSQGPKLEFIYSHLREKKRYFFVILFGLLALMSIQFVIPFITKNVVDIGIKSGDLQMIQYLLLGQAVLMASKAGFEIIRNYVVQHLSVRINYSLLSNFLRKLFRLTIPFFENRKIGDLLQRIRDHQRLELFITKSVLNVIISTLTIIVFSCVLLIFNKIFFFLFLGATVLYVSWILIFLNARKKIDWERFEVNSQNQTILIQVINGIQDLKIYGAHRFLFNKWDANQRDYINTSFKSLRINQIQETGAAFLYQAAQIVILYYSARLILNNQLTLGAMLSIEFIIGQLVSPVQQILMSVIKGVEAKLSMDRIYELWESEEETNEKQLIPKGFTNDIVFENVNFHHRGQGSGFTLKNINLTIEKGQTIALVGTSGSGKTTILKLLLGYYSDYKGSILADGLKLKEVDIEVWRRYCGVVLQDNFIFSDTIAHNITMGAPLKKEKLLNALQIAEMDTYVGSLPLKQNTIIGNDGKGLSQGQKQRILIARAVYRDPEILMFDEATNALDSETESNIMNNLKKHTKDKTVILVAHRLSTVRHADKIMVFDNGEVIETGKHEALIDRKGRYYNLVQQQLSPVSA